MYTDVPGWGCCGLALYAAFLANPEAPLDTSCVQDVPGPDFEGDPDDADWMFGTEDAWGDDAATTQ